METTQTRRATIGSVSSGTMRAEDLIPVFVDELASLGHDKDELARWTTAMDEPGYDADYDLEELFDTLNEYAPPYCYFGSHPGDSADYGFWIYEDIEHEFDGLRVNDLSEVPEDYTGEVLCVNDHGNISLYAASNGELTEIWSIV